MQGNVDNRFERRSVHRFGSGGETHAGPAQPCPPPLSSAERPRNELHVRPKLPRHGSEAVVWYLRAWGFLGEGAKDVCMKNQNRVFEAETTSELLLLLRT